MSDHFESVCKQQTSTIESLEQENNALRDQVKKAKEKVCELEELKVLNKKLLKDVGAAQEAA